MNYVVSFQLEFLSQKIFKDYGVQKIRNLNSTADKKSQIELLSGTKNRNMNSHAQNNALTKLEFQSLRKNTYYRF